MNTRLYVDTSVFGGLFDEQFADETALFFNKITKNKMKICVSKLVEEELAEAPPHVLNFYTSLKPDPQWLNVDDDILQLAKQYILSGALTEKSFVDAQHIACASVHGVSAIVSWNFKHIANFERQRAYNSVNKANGYTIINVYSPLNFNQINYDDKQ